MAFHAQGTSKSKSKSPPQKAPFSKAAEERGTNQVMLTLLPGKTTGFGISGTEGARSNARHGGPIMSPTNKFKNILSILDVKRNTTPLVCLNRTLENQQNESSLNTLDNSVRNTSKEPKGHNSSKLFKGTADGGRNGSKSRLDSSKLLNSAKPRDHSATNKEKIANNLKKIISQHDPDGQGGRMRSEERSLQNMSAENKEGYTSSTFIQKNGHGLDKGGFMVGKMVTTTLYSTGNTKATSSTSGLNSSKTLGTSTRTKSAKIPKANSFRAIVGSRKKIGVDMSQDKLLRNDGLKTDESSLTLVSSHSKTVPKSSIRKPEITGHKKNPVQTPEVKDRSHQFQTPSAVSSKTLEMLESRLDEDKNRDNFHLSGKHQGAGEGLSSATPKQSNVRSLFSPAKDQANLTSDSRTLQTQQDVMYRTHDVQNLDKPLGLEDHTNIQHTMGDVEKNGSVKSGQKDHHHSKHKLNLELVIDIEEILQNIQNCLRAGNPINTICSQYIEYINRESFDGIDKLFRDQMLRQAIRGAFIIEKASMLIFLYCFCERRVTGDIAPHLRNLSHLIHSSFLVVLELIFGRISGQSTTNAWYKRLKVLLDMKKTKKSSKMENLQALKANNQEALKVLSECFSNDSSDFIKEIFEILQNMDNYDISHAQTLLLKAIAAYKTNSKAQSDEEVEVQKNENPALPEGFTLIPSPYLPPMAPERTFTLVLDLDETLVHYEDFGKDGKFLIRPNCQEFLREMAQYYEIVVFTAAMQDYADWVLDNLDTEGCISYRLYRQHAVPNGVGYVKDLSRLGRDLAKMIIVDNVPENFQLQSDNGIFIRSWFNDPDDTALSELAPLLIEIVKKNVADIRNALRKFRDQMLENLNKGIQQPHLHLTLEDNN